MITVLLDADDLTLLLTNVTQAASFALHQATGSTSNSRGLLGGFTQFPSSSIGSGGFSQKEPATHGKAQQAGRRLQGAVDSKIGADAGSFRCKWVSWPGQAGRQARAHYRPA